MSRVESATAREMGEDSSEPEPLEPDVGWKDGLIRLLGARCAWCGNPLDDIALDDDVGVTWSCLEGCNIGKVQVVRANDRVTFVATSSVGGFIDHWRSVEGAYYDQVPRLRVEPEQVITCDWSSSCSPIAIIRTDSGGEHHLAFNEP